ncbi:MAG: glycoside hydrolase family 2 [Gemmatimonadetes bacterium]|nr:glycoside hydrolase family 2 [Gemmatimonadota bacterium]
MKRRDFVRGVAVAGAAGMLPLDRLSRFSALPAGAHTRLDDGWRFHLGDIAGSEAAVANDSAWEQVTLPHAARIESLVTGPPGTATAQWQGLCWYRRSIPIGSAEQGRKVFLHFEAAMNVADVWANGEHVARHAGGFLPFTVDVSDQARERGAVHVAVRLDNRDDPITGPKPLSQLDFNMYHGLYRYVHLVVKDRLHITDPLLADSPASGGVFVTTPRASAQSATVRVQAHVRNDHDTARTFRVRTTLLSLDGSTIARAFSAPQSLSPGMDADVVQELEVAHPRLWSPQSPILYVVRSEILVGGAVIDVEQVRTGIRRIEITRDGFRINGERMFLRGTNRHQEHPYVGFAVPAEAQHRDARRIKDAGFDYIRLSHYAHAPAFMDACDELGIVVMDCLPGWQYFGTDPAFTELQYRNCRDLIRRDRNHPCVIMWEVSLNETAMPPEFIARTHAIAHEELPGDQCFTSGWMHGYDVYIRARQHGGCPANGDHPCVVSEYGDWEYYAMTAGLDQDAFKALSPGESNSRQLRWQGERAQLQQATNFQEAHNDNRAGVAFADGLWVMYDYDRGYSPDVESSGCADIFRLPKYSWHFFRSQRAAAEGGPMAFIASEWSATSSTDVRVFSNCEQVELRLNGRVLSRARPDTDRMSTKLAHPPFTFRVPRFEAGALEAVGFVAGHAAARHEVRTAGPPARIQLSADFRGRTVSNAEKDLLFIHAALQDAHGSTLGDAFENIAYGVTGDARLIGANPFATDAGISSILVETHASRAACAVYALGLVRTAAGAHLTGASLALRGKAAPFELHFTNDDAVPQRTAALLVKGRVVATLDEAAAKVRMSASIAPTSRDPYHRGM